MNKPKWTLLVAALALMAVAGTALCFLRAHQRLGPPAVKNHPLPDDKFRVEVDLPERVLDYKSEKLPVDKIVSDFLPRDTSFGQRRYTAPDGFDMQLNVVLMGVDRTSLHKPEFCLGGQGWLIDAAQSGEITAHIERPIPYDLPVMKLMTTKQITRDGQPIRLRGVYLYWFVADNEYTASHLQRMWWTVGDLLRTGALPRWAYVSCFSACYPGQEGATLERMKQFIASAVPEFQLTPRAPGAGEAARR
jgi:hypothetical protein